MKNVCLFIGRFQPFHKGHLMVIQGMVKVCDKVVIGVGSSQEGFTSENPFTAQERRDMIQRALQGVDLIPKYDIDLVEFPDETDDETWAKKCIELAGGEVSAVWTGNENTKKCFEAIGMKVQSIKEVPRISATEVRRRMLSGEDWSDLVPEEVRSFVNEVEGVERMKKLSE